MKRLHNLDYLRGLAAIGIMIYHYISWTYGQLSAHTIFGRIGLYGVSVFYVLSGITLYHVYYDKLLITSKSLILFYKKRFVRIFPLLWLVTIITIVLSKNIPNIYDLLLNLTGLFGFVKWHSYFSPGVWSIGNELVFYSFFPIFIFLTKSFKSSMLLLSLAIFSLFLYFSFFKLDSNLNLSGHQWRTYINPLNQLFLFLGGFLIGLFFEKKSIKETSLILLLIIASGTFIFYPVHGDPIKLVTGFNRIIFSACCLMLCTAFFKLNIKLPDILHRPLTRIGENSYSIYLLHPMVFGVTGKVLSFASLYLFDFPEYMRITISILLTLIVSHFVYQHFEKYFMKFGRTKYV